MTETTDQAANADEKFRYSLHQVLETLIQNPKQVLLLDGGTGEELFRRNVPDDRKIWSATALVHPEYHHILEEVHSSFLHSGCSFISTNSYGVVPGVGFDEEEIATYMNQAGLIARQAATNFLSGKKQDEPTVQKIQHPVFVLGSLGPLIESYRPDLILTHEEGSKCYQRACVALAPHVDAYLGETLSSVAESLQVLDAGVRLKPDDRRPLLVSYTLDSNGNLRDGQDATRAIRQLIDQWKSKYSDIESTLRLSE
jgi:S-methylmethionine-dependent homocysteine/selenocysteine methylase